jgi:hypothetical protein
VPIMRSFLRVTVLFMTTILLPGPHDLFQLLLNDNRDILSDIVEPDIRVDDLIYHWNHIRITALGLYLIRVLAGKFCYLEAAMLDTALTDAKSREYIAQQYPEGQKPLLVNRILAVERFVNILEAYEAQERIRLASGSSDMVCSPVMPSLRQIMGADVLIIKNSDAWEQQEF